MGDIIEFVILMLIYFAIPITVLYFIIKAAVKNAIKELRNKIYYKLFLILWHLTDISFSSLIIKNNIHEVEYGV